MFTITYGNSIYDINCLVMIYFIDTLKKSFNERGMYSAMAKPRTDIITTFLSFPKTKLVTVTSRVKGKPERVGKI